MRVTINILVVLIISFPKLSGANDFQCVVGKEVLSSLGDGVTMRTCIWNQKPGLAIRTGPLELIKNGILILKARTNEAGKLHGQFTTWNDAGKLTERGDYVMGLKEGAWLVTNKKGEMETLYYRGGDLIEP